jgi:ribonuclease E
MERDITDAPRTESEQDNSTETTSHGRTGRRRKSAQSPRQDVWTGPAPSAEPSEPAAPLPAEPPAEAEEKPGGGVMSVLRRLRRPRPTPRAETPDAEPATLVPPAVEEPAQPPAPVSEPTDEDSPKPSRRRRRRPRSEAAPAIQVEPEVAPVAEAPVEDVEVEDEPEAAAEDVEVEEPEAAVEDVEVAEPEAPAEDAEVAVSEEPADDAEAQPEEETPSRRRRRRSSRRTRRRSRSKRSANASEPAVEAAAEPEPELDSVPDEPAPEPSEPEDAPDEEAALPKTRSRRRGRQRQSGSGRRHRTDTRGAEEFMPAEDELPPAPPANRVMLINDVEQQEVRIAVLADGKLQQLHQDRASMDNIVGSIHKGIVVNTVPNIDAAFIEFGFRKHGFLHASDVQPSAVNARSRSDSITALLHEGQEVVVQVTKEGIGDKGPSLTMYLSLPGRYMVLMPGLTRRGVSRRIVDEVERSRLRTIMTGLEIPSDIGAIARTAAMGHDGEDIERDIQYLLRLWEAIRQRAQRSKAPAMLYQESDPVTRVIRDSFSEDMKHIWVDSPEVMERVREFLRVVLPSHVNIVKLHNRPEPLFHAHGVEQEIERMHSRTVKLSTGGSIVIDQTEALVAIDVNSGTYKGNGDAENTALITNMEAASEVARQLRLRDLGGVIAVDFIDMEPAENRAKVERALWAALREDRARIRMLHMSAFCILEMTRQRQRPSLTHTAFVPCSFCHGTGVIKSHETLALQAIRQIKVGLDNRKLAVVELAVSPDAANYLNNVMREQLTALETGSEKTIRVFADPTMAPGVYSIRFLNESGREISGRKKS